MTPVAFVQKWQGVSLNERSAAQQHFLDLCALFSHPSPAEADPSGEWFTFERGASKEGGGDGFADVWKRGFFAIEYKGRHKDLDKAYAQILLYREALENPPLLAVCDLDRIVIHTNFTATAKKVYDIPLAELPEPRNLEILRNLFHDPEKLRPGATSRAITEEAAARLGVLANSMRSRGLDPAAVARFVDRLVFCLFAEDVGLLPPELFAQLFAKAGKEPARLKKLLDDLFRAMALGGDFGLETIRHFNGDLFSDSPALEMLADEIAIVAAATKLDWSAIDPSIFGTLFERGLDPSKRSQLGAHYTSREDIELLIDHVVMAPLREEWAALRATMANLLATGKKSGTGDKPVGGRLKKAIGEANMLKSRFLNRLAHTTVLDPACGSGNFLYVTLQKLKDLEKEAALHGAESGLATDFLPAVAPWQMHGIEISPYAFDLAQMALWIGFLQWTRHNGYGFTDSPLLRKMTTFQNRDAILDLADPDNPEEPEWPKVDFIVGNPPFLGGKMLRRELGDDYVDKLLACFKGRVPAEADLCCYWFEKARAQIKSNKCERAGLLATQAIRGGANREVLKRIKESAHIFFALSDRDWVLDGANVHVSMIGFCGRDGSPSRPSNGVGPLSEAALPLLDGKPVREIHANLSSEADATGAKPIAANLGVSFMGITPAGPFDLPFEHAREWLAAPNPHGRPNSDVLRPYLNGKDINQRSRGQWTIDFTRLKMEDAALYELPFSHLDKNVRPVRSQNNREAYRKFWWIYAEAREGLRKAFSGHPRYLATCRVAKHRLFSWLPAVSVPDSAIIAFARSDDYFFGVLHSRFHEIWSLAQGTQLEDRPRYTPTTCFETFPFPEATEPHREAVASAARELDALRERWLNPPEWTREEILEFPATPGGPWTRFMESGDGRAETGKAVHSGDSFLSGLRSPSPAFATARYPVRVPLDEKAASELKLRTLTNLYNTRPAWLANAHAALDEAVAAAYGFAPDLLTRLLERNQALVGANP